MNIEIHTYGKADGYGRNSLGYGGGHGDGRSSSKGYGGPNTTMKSQYWKTINYSNGSGDGSGFADGRGLGDDSTWEHYE